MTLGRHTLLGVACFQSMLLAHASFALTMKGQQFYHPKTRGDTIAHHRQLRLQQAHPNAGYSQPYEPIGPAGAIKIPQPHVMPPVAKTLSLHEAIALALRNNQNVKTAELQRIIDKFGLEVNIWKAYEPQITALNVTSTMQKNVPPVWNLTTGVSLPGSTLGTTAKIDYANNLLGGFGTAAISVTQPLLKGFGLAFNRIAYDNAIDAERTARLSFKDSIISVVDDVVKKYRSLVEAYNNLKTNEQSLKSQKDQVLQSNLQVKAGKMAKSDLLQQQENLESTKLSVVQQQDALRNAYQEFLTTLGLVPETKLIIDKNISIRNVRVPSRKEAIRIALAHNISYQKALISLRGDERSLLSAKNARKWQLDMTGSVTLGRTASVANGVTANVNTYPKLGFSLTVPINDLALKREVVQAKVSLENARMKLAQQKEDLIRNVANQLDSIHNQHKQIKISELAVKLQAQTLQNAELKLKYGKTTVFEVNSLTNQLVTQQVSLISTKITYLNDLTSLFQTLGTTLDKWKIKLRY